MATKKADDASVASLLGVCAGDADTMLYKDLVTNGSKKGDMFLTCDPFICLNVWIDEFALAFGFGAQSTSICKKQDPVTV